MKAMLLAAGKGTRLRPLTDDCPKCMMPLDERPLIDWQLRWLKKCDVDACVINLHYLPERVQDFVGDGAQYGLQIAYSYEPELLGTAGAVKKVADLFSDAPFYVIYSDNFSRWDLGRLRSKFETASAALRNGSSTAQPEPAIGVMAVHWREDVTSSGMVEMASDDRILRYVEKPKAAEVTSHWVNAGFYYLHPRVLDYIPQGKFFDFSYHVFQAMLEAGERLYVEKMEDPIIGIDTLDAYARANELAKSINGN